MSIISKERINMTADELKTFCKEMGLTYKELAEKLGMSEGGLKNAIINDKITSSIEHSFNMYKRILELENELKEVEALRTALKSLLKI